MPIEYHIDRELNLVLKRFTGDVDIAQLKRHWEELITDNESVSIAAWLTDIREAKIRYNGPELERLVRSVIEPRMKGVRWISAVVVNAGVQYGVTNQFSVYASGKAIVATFLSREEALEWVLKARDERDGTTGADKRIREDAC